MSPSSRNLLAGDFLLYDGECPVCSSYAAMSKLKRKSPDFRLLNARERPDLVAYYRARGKEINDGMILKMGEREFYGADAMSQALARPFLPYRHLVRLRKSLLRLLGRDLIA